MTWFKRLFGKATSSGAHPMRRHSVQCISPTGLHRMSYIEWGDPFNSRVLICVHGLTRNGRDFDFLAQALAADYRVVCPDIVGRGDSDWLKTKTEYAVPQYVADIVTLIGRLNVEEVDWVGTSMGGLIGMGLAAYENTPIKRLVLNDVGPVVTAISLQRIGQYVGRAPDFGSYEEAEAYVRSVSASFGPHTDEQWRHLTEHSIRPHGVGFRFAYDPAIGDSFRLAPVTHDVAIWPIYDAIKCPTLVMRGAESDLLMAETAQEMTRRGPHAKAVEIQGVGHAPTLMAGQQIDIVRQFLLNR